MSRERYSTNYTEASSRSLIHRLLIALLVILSLTLLVLTRAHNPGVDRLRARLMDITTPVVEFVSTPVSGVRALIRDKNALLGAFEENKQLREEADTLRHWQAVAQALKAENDALRNLAGYQPIEAAKYITARVVGQAPSGYSASIMINAGSAEGIDELQPVIDAYGLVGRVVDVGEHSARVLLLSDSASRIPVVSANGRIHAILAGTGSGDELMRLTFLGADGAGIAVGEQIVTTEEGSLIPGGVLIGTVFRRDSSGLSVKPLRPLAQSEYVRVIVAK
jgi:rod shape-determining protein MreC